MEATGLAVGVLGIAGLFNNAVDTFNYIQVGRNLAMKHQTEVLKLESTQLRLSRWGQSLGLSGDLSETRTLNVVFGSEDAASQAEKRLGHILNLLEDARKITQKLSVQDSATFDVASEGDKVAATLSSRMRAISKSRQNKTSLSRKAKWALYHEKTLTRLIEDCNELTKELEDMFPATNTIRKSLSSQEVAKIADAPGCLKVLAEVASSKGVRDDTLEQSINEQVFPGSSKITFHGSVNSSTVVGQHKGPLTAYWS